MAENSKLGDPNGKLAESRYRWTRISDGCWTCEIESFHLEVVRLDMEAGSWRGRVSIGDSYDQQWFVLRESWNATDAQTKRRVEKDLLDVLERWHKLYEGLKNNG